MPMQTIFPCSSRPTSSPSARRKETTPSGSKATTPAPTDAASKNAPPRMSTFDMTGGLATLKVPCIVTVCPSGKRTGVDESTTDFSKWT